MEHNSHMTGADCRKAVLEGRFLPFCHQKCAKTAAFAAESALGCVKSCCGQRLQLKSAKK
jgi:hypothetical protein